MKSAQIRTGLAGLAVALGLLAGVAWIERGQRARISETAAWVAHTHATQDSHERLLSLVLQAERKQRSYVLTGLPVFLDEFEEAVTRLAREERTVAALTRDERQKAALSALKPIVAERIAFARWTMELRRTSGAEAAAKEIATLKGEKLTDEIRARFAPMDARNKELLQECSATARAEAGNAVLLEAAGTGLSMALLITVFALVLRENRRRRQAELSLAVANQRLEERAQARTVELEAQRRHNELLLTSAGEGLYGLDQDACVTFINPAGARILGYTVAELLGQPMHAKCHHTHADGRPFPREECPIFAANADGQVHQGSDDVMWRKDGSAVPVEYTSTPLRDLQGAISGAMVVFRNITERKQAEKALQSSLREKTALLKEVHHRVKNNLQVITSLLRLETRRSAEPSTVTVLQEMQARIQSMALLHEMLYQTDTFARVDLANYLRRMATQLARGQIAAPGAVSLSLDLSPVEVDVDQAIPAALICNELLSNSLKHAFPEGRAGEVRLALDLDAAGLVRLCVSDTGVGLSPDFETRRTKSLGLQLVSDLSRQLGGTFEVEGKPTKFTVTFPLTLESLPAPGV